LTSCFASRRVVSLPPFVLWLSFPNVSTINDVPRCSKPFHYKTLSPKRAFHISEGVGRRCSLFSKSPPQRISRKWQFLSVIFPSTLGAFFRSRRSFCDGLSEVNVRAPPRPFSISPLLLRTLCYRAIGDDVVFDSSTSTFFLSHWPPYTTPIFLD